MKRVLIEDFSRAIQYFNAAPKQAINDLRSGCVKISGAKVPFYVATLESGTMHYYISDGLFYALGCDSPDDQIIFETVKSLEAQVPDKAVAAARLEEKRKEAKEEREREEHNKIIQANIAALLDGIEDFNI